MKCPRAKVWKWSAKAALTAAPPIAPRIGAAWAATFSLTTTPKRAAICEISRATTGAGRAATPSSGDEARAVADRLGERGPDGEIAALEGALSAPLSAEREHFDAGESRFRRAQVLAFLARDLGDRAQKDRGRDRQFDRQRRQAQRASDRPGRRRGELMSAVSGLCRRVQVEGAQSELERAPESGLAHMRDHPPRRLRHRAAQHPDRTTDRVGQPLGEARPFKAGDRLP